MEVSIVIAAKELDLLTSLEPDEQVVLISLAKNLIRSRAKQTEAQKKFAQIRKKYEQYDYSMEDIDSIFHGEEE